MKTQDILDALPLVAGVLGKNYGVRIKIGGDVACTNGTTIQLPALPVDAPERMLRLAKGFVDHESAHIRATDFSVLAGLTPLEKHIVNILEDYRVEHVLADIFPGCRENFTWLIADQLSAEVKTEDSMAAVLNWLLLTVRSWDVPALEENRSRLAQVLDTAFPGLCASLEKVLEDVRTNCASSQDCVVYAKRIVDILEQYRTPQSSGAMEESMGEDPKEAQPSPFAELINATQSELPPTMGEHLATELMGEHQASTQERVSIATACTCNAEPIHVADVEQAKRVSTRLKTRLLGLLQASKESRVLPSRHGRLKPTLLYRAATGSPKLFVQHTPRTAMNTAVHLLVDVSGSMSGQVDLALASCYAVGSALQALQVSVGISAFPAGDTHPLESVAPLIYHGERVHSRIAIPAYGSTPMGPALWWVMQTMLGLKEARKIIFIVSDGSPDSYGSVEKALETAKAHGFEIYGIGIESTIMEYILPGHSRTVYNLGDLCPAMFGLLHNTLIPIRR